MRGERTVRVGCARLGGDKRGEKVIAVFKMSERSLKWKWVTRVLVAS
jgi:hypothetical protein